MSQQAVIDAWADMASWVEKTLPTLAISQSLPYITEDIGDIGACNALNVPDGEDPAIWGSAGDAIITITGLNITAMTNVQIQPATAQSDTAFLLPLSFGSLQVAGNYSYTQPCALYDAGHETATTSTSDNGSISWAISNGTLTYAATLNGQLSISSAAVAGDATVVVTPNTGGLPSWIVAIGNFFSSFNEQQALTTSVGNVFANASFTTTMVDLLNSELGGGA